MSVESITDRYLAAIAKVEDQAIARINASLDEAFRSMVSELRSKFSKGKSLESTVVQAERLRAIAAILKASDPTNKKGWVQVMESLITDATALGQDYAEQLIADAAPKGTFQAQTLDVPIEAIKKASFSATEYLQRWGLDYSSRVSEIVGAALAEGKGTRATGKDLRALVEARFPELGRRTKVLKARVENIARTESLKASNGAAFESYQKNGIDLFMWFATGDDRTCPYCWPRAGSIYRMQDGGIPCHCQCRCTASPVNSDWLAFDDSVFATAKEHFKQVKAKTGAVAAFTDPAPFEIGGPHFPGTGIPDRVWSPTSGWLDKALERQISESG